MFSSDINKILSQNKGFIGCYALDKLPIMESKYDCSTIINTDPAKAKGDHWVAMRMTINKCFYFDSFGVPIQDKDIKQFAKEYDEVIYSNICIQDLTSVKCGEFCIAFINNVNSITSYEKFINMFYPEIFINDSIVSILVKQKTKIQKKN